MPEGIRFAGGRSESWVITAGSPVDWTGGSSFDTTYSDASFQFPNAGDQAHHLIYADDGSVTTIGDNVTVWWHAYVWLHQAGGTTRPCTFYDSSNHPWLQLIMDSSNNWHLQANTGTGASPTWTDLGSTPAATSDTPIDIKIVIDSGGTHSATLYSGGSVTTATGTWTQASFAEISYVYSAAVDASFALSQVLMTEGRTTIGAHVDTTSKATGAGHYTAWTGAYTDVNNAVTGTTSNSSTTAGDEQSYPMGNITVPSGHYIASVFYWLKGSYALAGSPQNIKALLRESSTDHVGASNLPGIAIAKGPLLQRYDNDPGTGTLWAASAWNAPVELGYVSET